MRRYRDTVIRYKIPQTTIPYCKAVSSSLSSAILNRSFGSSNLNSFLFFLLRHPAWHYPHCTIHISPSYSLPSPLQPARARRFVRRIHHPSCTATNKKHLKYPTGTLSRQSSTISILDSQCPHHPFSFRSMHTRTSSPLLFKLPQRFLHM